MKQSDSFLDTASDEEIERAAAFMVDLMRLPLRLAKGPEDVEKILAVIRRAFEEPESLKKELVVEARKSGPAKLREDLSFLSEFMRAPRRVTMDLIGESLPSGIPGKRPKITHEVEKQIVEMAQRLWPAVRALIELRMRPSTRTVAESIEYLEGDYPEASRSLLQRLDVIGAFFSRSDRPKSQKVQARRLVFEVIGRQFDIAPSTAAKWVSPYLKSKDTTN